MPESNRGRAKKNIAECGNIRAASMGEGKEVKKIMTSSSEDSDHSDGFVRVGLNGSYYAKIVFQDVKDYYSPGRDLVCWYASVSDDVQQEGDRVAIFRVGWSDVENYVAVVPCAPNKAGTSAKKNEFNVKFEASTLPEDNGDFYQFCYITKDGDIRGGSTPFLFKMVSPDDILSVEDIENDLILIQNRTTILEQSLQNAMKEKSKLLIEKQLLSNNLQEMRANVDLLEGQIKEKDAKIVFLQNKMTAIEAEAEKQYNELRERNVENEHFIAGLRTALTTFAKDKEDIDAQIKTLFEDREKLKEIVQNLENKLEKALETEKLLVSQVSGSQLQNQQLNDFILGLRNIVSEKDGQIGRLEETLQLEKTHNTSLTTHVIDTENMLAAMATSKALATQELQRHVDQQPEFEKCKQQLQELCQTLEKKLAETEKELENANRLFMVVENDCEFYKLANETLSRSKSDLESRNERLVKQVSDLQDRVQLGAEEYRQKYVEWHKVNTHYSRLQQKIQRRLSEVASAPRPAVLSVPSSETSITVDSSDTSTLAVSRLAVALDNMSHEEQIACWNLTQQAAQRASGETLAREEQSFPLNHVQKNVILKEMVNQLHKFQSSANGVTGGSSVEETVEPAAPAPTASEPVAPAPATLEPAVATPTAPERYPYPPCYPYPQHQQQTVMPTTRCAAVADDDQLSYVLVETPQQPLPQSPTSVPESFCRASPWPPYSCENVSCRRRAQPLGGEEGYPRALNPEVNSTVEEDWSSVGETNARAPLRCPICAQMLSQDEDINEHLDAHLFLKCPVCFLQFDRETESFEKFNSHVVGHLD